MARSRFSRHLFACVCALVAALMTGCFLLASVQLARLSESAQLDRVAAVATALADAVSSREDGIAPDEFAAETRRMALATGTRVDLLAADGGLLAGSATDAATERTAAGDTLLAEARAGRIARTTSYDARAGRRLLCVAAPVGPAGRPTAIVRVTADTSASDAALARSQRWLLLGFLACAAAGLAAAAVLAARLARPVVDISASAARLARGDVDAPIPTAELDALARLAEAVAAIREQLVVEYYSR